MPNWVENDLKVKGDPEAVTRFTAEMEGTREDGVNTYLDEQKLIPYPQNQGWDYEWCINNWGTKWGFCETQSPEITTVNGKAEAFYTFSTAWSPAIPLVAKMAEKNPHLSFTWRFYERGMEYKGKIVFKAGKLVSSFKGEYHGNRGG